MSDNYRTPRVESHVYHPLTTEEPLNNPELEQEVESINDVNPEDDQVAPAVILDKEGPNKMIPVIFGSSSEDEERATLDEEEDKPDIIIDNKKYTTASVRMTLPPHAPATTVTNTTTALGALDISPISNHIRVVKKEDTNNDDTDDELIRITEANRFIPHVESNKSESKTGLIRRKSLRSQSVSTRRHLLVFADKPSVTKKSDRIIVHNHYGAGPDGILEKDLKPTRRSRGYLVACDFSEESFQAIEWTMGTMMRDGDQLYVATAVNREDNPEAVKEAGLSLSKEASGAVTEEAKKTMGQMLLFGVDLYTYAICGRVKDVLSNLIDELPLTMVICGSRGRGTVKGLLMGSISTFLVHKSPVPVTVIRPQKKKKNAHKRPLHAAPLSQSVKSGQLAVDELSKPAATTTTM